jgi:hypothetical protein
LGKSAGGKDLATNGKLPKAQRYLEKSNVSEHHAEQTSGGSVGAEPVVTPQASAEPAPAKPEAMDAAVPAVHQLESPMISPDHEAPKADAPKIEPVKLEPIEIEPVKLEPAKSEDVKPEQAKSDQTKSDQAKFEQAKSESIGLDQIKPDPIKTEPTVVEPVSAAPKLELASLAAAVPALIANEGSKAEPSGSPAPKSDTSRASRLVMAPATNDILRAEAVFAAAAAATRGGARAETAAGSESADRAKAERRDPPRATAAQPAARRTLPIAAMLAIAVAAGAAGGALATIALVHAPGGQATAAASANTELSASVGKIENDIATLKASLEQTNQTSLVELNKTSERLDRLEKAEGELAKVAKPGELQKLSEAVERLRTAQASAPAAPATTRERETTAARERETTASVAPATSQPTATTAAGVPAQSTATPPALGRLPVVDGWVLRDVGRGGALIEGRQGLYEVYAGDPVPGLGKVDAIRKQDGRWVVVTTKGLVVAR